MNNNEKTPLQIKKEMHASAVKFVAALTEWTEGYHEHLKFIYDDATMEVDGVLKACETAVFAMLTQIGETKEQDQFVCLATLNVIKGALTCGLATMQASIERLEIEESFSKGAEVGNA